MRKYIGGIICLIMVGVLIYHCEKCFNERGKSVWTEDQENLYSCTIQVENHLGVELSDVRVRLYQEKTGSTVLYFQTEPLLSKSDNRPKCCSVTDSDEHGLIHLYGLPEGTYYLEEIKVPKGYENLQERITIQINEESDKQGIDYYIVNGRIKTE